MSIERWGKGSSEYAVEKNRKRASERQCACYDPTVIAEVAKYKAAWSEALRKGSAAGFEHQFCSSCGRQMS